MLIFYRFFGLLMITLYEFSTCPFCHRVRATLDALHVPFRAVEVDRNNKPDIVKQTGGTVPVIDDDGVVVADSAKIILYLQQKYGTKQ